MVNSLSVNLPAGAVSGSLLDLEAAIANLLLGTGCNSLELPSCLTPEQRKQVKLIAAQHPELKSESYGFGTDRRLHVFKKSATTCVRVKNTFVDGLEDPDSDGGGCAPVIFRSAPVDLRRYAKLATLGTARESKLELPPLYTKKSQPVTPSSEGASDAPAVPPGTFDHFPLGTMVVIEGLVSAPAFNGARGVVHSLNAETNRYDVLLDEEWASPSGGRQWTKIKYANLRPTPSFHIGHETSSAAA
jgi:hypothetical protein